MGTWTEQRSELLRLGKWVEENYQPGFLVNGEPITNEQMLASSVWRRDQRDNRIAADGCCGEGRDSAGRCYGHGLCPLFVKAKAMVRHGAE